MSQWLMEPRDDGYIHVLPIEDLRPHSDLDCWCKPTSHHMRPDIIVHHSMDRREEYERGERKAS